MKEKSNHLKSILNSIAIALVVPLFIFASQTSSLAVQPSVAAGGYHTVGLKSDGTVVAVGFNESGQLNVGSWRDIVQVAAGVYHTVGIKSDGTVVAVGDNGAGQCNLFDWNLIVDKNLLYNPVTPCRIVDTRKAGGAISAGGIRSYNVWGAVASQGGNSAGCPSPKGESRAVHVNVTSVPLGNGYITAYPFGSAAPLASLVNYRSDAQNVANSGTVKTCFNCAKDINIKSGGGKTHVVIDVLGYYFSKP